MNTHWTTGVYLGVIFAGIGLLIGLGLVWTTIRGERGFWNRLSCAILSESSVNEHNTRIVSGVLAALFVASSVGFWFLGMWPLKSEYHQWRYHQGTIQQISSRIVGGDSINQRFVVRLTGFGTPLACDDTRCSLLHKGDQLGLSCVRQYQGIGASGTSGYSCNYVKSSADDR